MECPDLPRVIDASIGIVEHEFRVAVALAVKTNRAQAQATHLLPPKLIAIIRVSRSIDEH